jgi:hypothetical protein
MIGSFGGCRFDVGTRALGWVFKVLPIWKQRSTRRLGKVYASDSMRYVHQKERDERRAP